MLKELKEWHEEELSDYDKYMKAADNMPDKFKPILRDIAEEEKNHAKFIKEMIDECDWCEEAEEDTTHHEESSIEETPDTSLEEKNKIKTLLNGVIE